MDKLFGSWWPWGRTTTITTQTNSNEMYFQTTTNFRPTTPMRDGPVTAATTQYSNVYSLDDDGDDDDTELIKSTTTDFFTETSSSSSSTATTSFLPSSSSSSSSFPATEDFVSATYDDDMSSSSSTTFSSFADYIYDEFNSTLDIFNNLTNSFTNHTTVTTNTTGTRISVASAIIDDELLLHPYGGVGGSGGGMMGTGGASGVWNCSSLSDINCSNNFYEQNTFMSNDSSTFGVVIFGNFSNLTQGIRNNGAHILTGNNTNLFDDETTLHLVSMIMTAVFLAIIILATVIGKSYI